MFLSVCVIRRVKEEEEEKKKKKSAFEYPHVK